MSYVVDGYVLAAIPRAELIIDVGRVEDDQHVDGEEDVDHVLHPHPDIVVWVEGNPNRRRPASEDKHDRYQQIPVKDPVVLRVNDVWLLVLSPRHSILLLLPYLGLSQATILQRRIVVGLDCI